MMDNSRSIEDFTKKQFLFINNLDENSSNDDRFASKKSNVVVVAEV
jgi:hypothetical protein